MPWPVNAPERRRPKAPNTLLRDSIARSGMSYAQVGAALTAMARADGERHISPGRTRVGHWVCDGEQPKDPIPRYLTVLLTERLGVALTPADLGLTGDRGSEPEDRGPAGAGEVSRAASVTTARAYASAAAASDLRPGDIEDLELAVAEFAASYAAREPGVLWGEVAARRERAASLLHHHRHTVAEGRELSRHAGMLSVILAWCAHDLGRRELVEAYCDDAWVQAEQAGVMDIGAWAEDVRATEALYGGRAVEGLAAVSRGLAVAVRDSVVEVRLTAQLARVHARMRDQAAFERALGRARRDRPRLPEHRSGLFGMDTAVLEGFEASSLVWLGDARGALKAAGAAVERYEAMPGPFRAPTRLAIAHLDRALAYTALGEAEPAVAAAAAAMSGQRVVHGVRARAAHVAHRMCLRFPQLAEVAEVAGVLGLAI
ncbi:hypothetical protein [Streptomyces tsukubensis]|uniref:hypothetical protein n=1 Tax=Streptomyces tsukubensis TaxID=83656 RepID=UPI00344FD95B